MTSPLSDDPIGEPADGPIGNLIDDGRPCPWPLRRLVRPGACQWRPLARWWRPVGLAGRRPLATMLLTAVLLLVVLAPPATAAPLVVTDDSGARIELPRVPQRIVSLAPSATEMLFAIGAGARIVATVEWSVEPAAARAIPRIGDAFAIDLERLVALRPDVIVGWPEGNNPAQLAKVARLGIPMYRQTVNTLRDLPVSMRRLGRLTALSASADAAARDVEMRLDTLQARYATKPAIGVFLQIWDRPLYTVGGRSLMSDALRICGARNVFAELGEIAPAVDIEAVLARNPDAIIAVAEDESASGWLAGWKRFAALRAVRRGALASFQDARLTRLGPGAVAAMGRFCEIVDGVRSRALSAGPTR